MCLSAPTEMAEGQSETTVFASVFGFAIAVVLASVFERQRGAQTQR